MSDSDVETVRLLYERVNDGGIEAAIGLIAEDFVAEVPPSMSAEPDVYRGHEGVRRFWMEWAEVIEGMTLEIEECRSVDDEWVLAITRASGTGAGSGASVASGSFAQLAQFRDGQVVRVRLFGDVGHARAAAGLD